MRTKIIIFATALIAAGLISSCKNPVAPNKQPLVGIIVNSIDSVVAGFGELPKPSTWSLREDSLSTDTTVSSDTVGQKITKTKWLVERQSYSASSDAQKFMEFNPDASILWPGDLVQGYSVASGVLNFAAVPRTGGVITMDVVSGNSSSQSVHVDSMCNAAVNDAMNSILQRYQGTTPANYAFDIKQVYSATQLSSDLGLGYSGPVNSINDEFSVNTSKYKSCFAVELTQDYFTMSCDDPARPSDMIDPSVTPGALEAYLQEGGPLCYISSVTYGRIYILLYQSTASSIDLENALNYAYNEGIAHGNVNSKTDFQNIMAQTTVHVVQIGGNAEQGLDSVTALSYNHINSFLTKGADFSPDNRGAPISYRVNYLANDQLVALNDVMQYTVTTKVPIDTSASSYTQSAFGIFVNRLNVTQLGFDNMHGGCKMVVGLTNNITGKDSVIWTCPLSARSMNYYPVYDGPGFDDFGTDFMSNGKNYQLYWTVPEFLLANNSDTKLWIDFFINDYEAKEGRWNWGWSRAYIQYDQTTQSWEITGTEGMSSDDLLITDCSNSDVFGKFVYTISVDGKPLQ